MLYNPWVQLLLLAIVLAVVYFILGKFGIPQPYYQWIGWLFAALIVIDAILLVTGTGGWVPLRQTSVGLAEIRAHVPV